MPPEQVGTGCIAESNVLGARTGVPLQPANTTMPHSLTQPAQLDYDAEHARMEAWMDEHQEFVQEYFIRKATRQVVDAWLVSHATAASNDASVGSPTHTTNGQSCSSRGGSGATTPVRKISAHEFERGGLLKPIVNTIDGTPTFLSVGSAQNECFANNGTATSGGIGSGGSGGGGGGSNSSNNAVGQYHPHYPHHHQLLQQQQQQQQQQHYHSNPQQSHSNSHHNSHHNHHHHHNHHYNNYHCNHQTTNGGFSNYHRQQRLSRNELKQLDEKELIFELVKDICNELEVRTLCHKILQNVSILLNADRGSLFLVQGRCGGSDGPKKCLVSKLFDVCPRSTVEEMEQREEVRVAWGTGIAGHVAKSGEPVNIPDAYQDKRFNHEIDSLTGYRTKALLCMPIKDSSGDVIGVAQVINKLNGECFSETDEKVFASYLQFCGIGLRNAQLFEKSQLEIKRNQVLLDLARMIFEEQSTIEHMVFRILTHMQSLIQCQRVQILLVHEPSKGSFSRVFDFEANDLSAEDSVSRTSPYESRFPINVGITGYVATTGETVNIPNAYEDDRFDASVDENSNFRHKSILCMAIKNSLGQIIGVIQLVNKFDDLSFTKNDENFVEAFAIFCGMGIHNTHMYEKAVVAMAKQSVTLEVLSYHASATIEEAHRLRRLRIPSSAHFCLHDFKFDDIHFEDDDTLKACLRMFLDLDFVERFHIDYEVLCRWLLSVKKNYRNVTYHNWRHAFNVAQMMFAILTATQWWKIFGEIECLALIIGCLCHDLDHRGTNNSFQIKASSPLAQLYSTSTMEHHHFDQCLMILNSPGNQILANLSSEDYCRVIRVLEDAILSTDLAVYFRKRGPFLQSVREKPLSYWVDDEPRALLRAMSMTVCDLSAITKPWEIEKRVADLVSSEFFEQGDMEKAELNITPIDIMNREKENELPMMQVGFIESICMPIYEAFGTLSDKLEPLLDGVRANRQHWIELAEEVRTKSITDDNSQALEVAEESSLSNIAENADRNNNNTDAITTTFDTSTTTTTNGVCCDEACEDVNGIDECIASEANASHKKDDIEGSGVELSDVTTTAEVCISDENHSSSCTSTPPPSSDEGGVDENELPDTSAPATTTCCGCPQAQRSDQNNASTLPLSQKWLPQNAIAAITASHHSKSTPAISACGTVAPRSPIAAEREPQQHHSQHCDHLQSHSRQESPQNQHHHHNHQHHYHNHRSHHHHHHQKQQQQYYGTPASINGSESDKIPRIVGKLANLDSMQLYAACLEPPTNGIGFLSNGHFSIVGAGQLLARRHSETNGLITRHSVAAATTAASLCEK